MARSPDRLRLRCQNSILFRGGFIIYSLSYSLYKILEFVKRSAEKSGLTFGSGCDEGPCVLLGPGSLWLAWSRSSACKMLFRDLVAAGLRSIPSSAFCRRPHGISVDLFSAATQGCIGNDLATADIGSAAKVRRVTTRILGHSACTATNFQNRRRL